MPTFTNSAAYDILLGMNFCDLSGALLDLATRSILFPGDRDWIQLSTGNNVVSRQKSTVTLAAGNCEIPVSAPYESATAQAMTAGATNYLAEVTVMPSADPPHDHSWTYERTRVVAPRQWQHEKAQACAVAEIDPKPSQEQMAAFTGSTDGRDLHAFMTKTASFITTATTATAASWDFAQATCNRRPPPRHLVSVTPPPGRAP